MEIIIGIVLTVGLVFSVIVFIGTEVIYRKRDKMLDAIFMYAISQKFKDRISCNVIRDWNLIDCLCPWRWRYKYWLPEEELKKIAPFLGRK